MAQTTVYKPSTVRTKGGVAFLVDSSGSQNPPVATLKDGRKITAKLYNDVEGRKQFLFPPEIANESDFQIAYDGKTTNIGTGSSAYEGSDFSNLQQRSKGSLGDTSGGGGSANYSPNQVGDYGFAPADLTSQFPDTALSSYTPIKSADYKYTDPFKFAQKFGDLNRQQTNQNYNQAKGMGLDAVNTELQGLQGFAPAAAALQQTLTSADNTFNQSQRTNQVNTALPGVGGQLNDQASRATSFANGRVPDPIQDRALELGIRSGAADRASAGGFGVNSSAASKASDLMSASERVKLSQYGDQLLTGNINQKANLFLAPTEYANSGSQIRVNPTVDAGTRAAQYGSELNANTIINPTNALSNVVQQRQFATNLNQQTNQFNASNTLQNNQFNASSTNNMNLQKFGYQVGLAGANAGAAQTNANTGIEIQQQQQAQQAAADAQKNTQNANSIGAIATGVAGLGSAIINNLGGSSSKPGTTGSGSTGSAGTGDTFSSIDGSIGAGDATLNDPNSSLNSTPNFEYNPSGAIDFGNGVSTTTSLDQLPNYDSGLGDLSNPVALAARAAIPHSEAVKLSNFQKDTGVQLSRVAPKALAATANGLVKRSSAVLSSAGISSTPKPGHIQAGYDTTGKPLYVDKTLATSNNIQTGANTVHVAKSIIQPFNVFKGDDLANFNKISDIASNPGFIKGLDALHMNGSASDFVNTLNQALKTINGGKSGPAKTVKLPAKVGSKIPFSTTSVRGL